MIGSATPTAFPWLPIIAVCAFWLASSAFWCAPVPYMPFFVHEIHPSSSLQQIGYVSGWVIAAAQLGQMLTSIAWGMAADRIGRRPVLLFCMLASSIAFAAFGFARTLPTAIAFSFAVGALDGVMGVTKCVLSETCGDEHSDQGWGMIGFVNAVARLVSPTIGSFFAEPMKKQSLAAIAAQTGTASAWSAFPFALPSLVVGVFGAATFAVGCCFIPETLHAKKKKKKKERKGAERAAATLESDGDDDDEEAAKQMVRLGVVDDEEEEEEEDEDEEEAPTASSPTPPALPTLAESLLHRDAVLTVALYAILGLANAVIDTSLPLWLLSSRENHGFELDANAIGLVLASPAVFEILYLPFVFPVLTKRFGYLRVFRWATAAAALASFLTPLIALLNEAPTVVQWGALILQQSIMLAGVATCYSAVFPMINNSVLSLHRGQINGVAQTVVGLTRAIGPAVAGSVYAWSVGRPPLGFRLVFFVAGSVYAVLLLVAMQLPASINKQRQSRSSSSSGGCELIKL